MIDTRMAIGVLAGGLFATTAFGSTAAEGQELVVVASGGAFQAALEEYFYEPYEQATGIDIVHVPAQEAEQYARLRAMVEVGNVEWDVVTSNPIDLLLNRDVLQPLDCSQIPNAEAYGVPGTCGEYGLLRTIGATVIAYNTETFPDGGPTSWAEFWDVEAYPGTRCLPGYGGPEGSTTAMMMALMADGVADDALFPLDIDRAVAKLREIGPHVVLWWGTGDQSMAGMRNRECDASAMWSGRVIQLINQGEPIAITWNQSIDLVGLWSIPLNPPNVDLSYDFLNFFMTNPESHLQFSTDMVYDTANAQALSLVPEDQLHLRSTHGPNLEAIIVPDYPWITENADEVRLAFDEFLTE